MQERLKICLLLKNYVTSKGYLPGRGRKKPTGPTKEELAQEFHTNKSYIDKMLNQNIKEIKKISFKVFINILVLLRQKTNGAVDNELTLLPFPPEIKKAEYPLTPEESIPPLTMIEHPVATEIPQETVITSATEVSLPEPDHFHPDFNISSTDEEEEKLMSDMVIKKKLLVQEKTGLKDDISVSNRVMRMEAKLKEVSDYLEGYKRFFKAQMEGINFTLIEELEKKKEIGDPWLFDHISQLAHIIQVLDLTIEKLDKV